MTDSPRASAADIDRIVASARRLGVELDEMEAMQWLTAVALAKQSADVVVDIESGVYGHRVTMLDFSPEDLAFFRSVGDLVEFADEDDVETALALSGSAAQSKVQTYPGDCDYFERVNIKAPTREAACRRLGEIIRAKALATAVGRHVSPHRGEVRQPPGRHRAQRARHSQRLADRMGPHRDRGAPVLRRGFRRQHGRGHLG